MANFSAFEIISALKIGLNIIISVKTQCSPPKKSPVFISFAGYGEK